MTTLRNASSRKSLPLSLNRLRGGDCRQWRQEAHSTNTISVSTERETAQQIAKNTTYADVSYLLKTYCGFDLNNNS
ncbi:MAG: hypothetical protein LBH53_00945 [Puniceicoccales bacterium]|nr:hypothetical protein [Puniceicoccales bacterium]